MPHIRSRVYLPLAIGLNCLILALLILDSRSINSLDINIGLLPDRWEGGVSSRKRDCGMCAANSSLCNELGEEKLDLAIWYGGTGERMRRFLHKAERGEGFTVGVVGGSVSKGYGLGFADGWSEQETPINMNRMIFDHLNDLFPAPLGEVIGDAGGNGKNGFVNGAQGGQGTNYFSLCFGEHIPDNTDLVLIDMSINDELYLVNMNSYELLLRGVLNMPNQPAVINMHIFALMFGQMAMGGDLHSGLNQFYDISTISLRALFLPDVLASTDVLQDMFFTRGMRIPGDLSNTDLRHLSALGHRRTAELVNAYIDTQICRLHSSPARDPEHDQVTPLPRMLMQMYDPDLVVPPLKPMCLSMSGNKHPLIPDENEGWEPWNWKEKKYIRATLPGSRLGVKFTTSLGSVQLHYLKSASFGLGTLRCWVDDEREKVMEVPGYWTHSHNIGVGTTIRDDLLPGDHMLHCELLDKTDDPSGGTEFRIISVMSI